MVAAACFVLGIIVGRRSGATIPPTAISVTMPDAGVATAHVSATPAEDHVSVTCRAEPPPPPKQITRTVYVKGDPVQLVCPEAPACPVLLCEGTASSRLPGVDVHTQVSSAPPTLVTVERRESLRKWGIGPGLGLSSSLGLHPGLGAAWQPIPEIEVHGTAVWTGCTTGVSNCFPVGLTADVLYRF